MVKAKFNVPLNISNELNNTHNAEGSWTQEDATVIAQPHSNNQCTTCAEKHVKGMS